MPRTCLLNSFKAAIKAADPKHIVPKHLPDPPKGRTLVIGAGKAAAAMALAVENHWPHDAPIDGLVITRYGHSLVTQKIKVVEAGHPLPDDNGVQASHQILTMTKALGAEDLLLCLFSGGGSSLLSLPIPSIALQDLRELTHQLLCCGATIQEVNAVRKHLSAIQGGRLAAICHAPIHALIISDVTGDDPTHIASGPCTPDPTTYADAIAVINKYHIEAHATIKQALLAGSQQQLDETPKPGCHFFTQVENKIIASANQSLLAAQIYFQKNNIAALIQDEAVTGEARNVGKAYATLTREFNQRSQLLKPPVALLSGGETTVTVKGRGCGGRNTEFLLSLLIALNGLEKVYAIACDTDGIDGSENNAGAIITPDSLHRAKALGMNTESFLANNDSYHFFEKLDDLIMTGPTYTNVNDYRAILIL
ncbi:MAG: glycerate kinase [Nitrosomonas sp.]|nr:glycerate kinase [Nitrosomonas sp.]